MFAGNHLCLSTLYVSILMIDNNAMDGLNMKACTFPDNDINRVITKLQHCLTAMRLYLF